MHNVKLLVTCLTRRMTAVIVPLIPTQMKYVRMEVCDTVLKSVYAADTDSISDVIIQSTGANRYNILYVSFT